MSNLVLEKFIHEVIDEALLELAKQPQEAEKNGLALSYWSAGTTVYFVLYHPSGLQEICNEINKQPAHLSLDNKLDSALYLNKNPVVAYIRMKKDECGWVIQNSVADKGYGPMMYDIALSYAGKTGVVPDRVEGVSPAARNIWRYYMTKRRNDIRTYPFSQDDECAVYGEDEDAWFLDVKYILRNPDMSKVSNLTSKSEQILAELQKTASFPVNEILRRLGSFFFDQKY